MVSLATKKLPLNLNIISCHTLFISHGDKMTVIIVNHDRIVCQPPFTMVLMTGQRVATDVAALWFLQLAYL